MKRLVLVLVVVGGLAVSACGGGSDKKASGVSSTTPAPTTTVASGATYTGDKNSPFCQLAGQFILRFENLPGKLQGSPEALRADVGALSGAVAAAQAAAPAEIKSYVETLAKGFSQFVSRLEAANYDGKAAAPEVAKLGTPALLNAVQQVQAYGDQVCGIGTPSSTP